MTVIDAAVEPDPVQAPDPGARDCALATVAQARLANAGVRFLACAVISVMAAAVVGYFWAFAWLAGVACAVMGDTLVYARLLKTCDVGPSARMTGATLLWTAVQSAYANSLSALLWFAPNAPGETLAIVFLMGGLANAAVTLRYHSGLAAAGVAPTIAFALGLPIAKFVSQGGHNVLDLMPLAATLLLIGYSVNLWRSLRASDQAQVAAQVAAARERQASATATAAKSDMMWRVRNELRTPMAALAGAAELLRRSAATAGARAHVDGIIRAREVLQRVLDDLDDPDGSESDQMRIEASPTDPREIARQVVAAFRPAANDKNLELFLDIAPDAPVLVEIDPVRVRQVLFNLLANAVRYTAHGGVRMHLQSVTDAAPGRAKLVFSVADTGAGMSRSQLALLFGPQPAGSDDHGSGLQISIRLTRLMGGKLVAKSELGQGSVIQFTLEAPVCAARDAA